MFCHRSLQIFQMCCYWWHGRPCGFPDVLFIPSLSFLTTAQITTVSLSLSQHYLPPELHKLIYVLHRTCVSVVVAYVCLLSRMWALRLVILDFFCVCNLVNMWNRSAFTVVKGILPQPVALWFLYFLDFLFYFLSSFCVCVWTLNVSRLQYFCLYIFKRGAFQLSD